MPDFFQLELEVLTTPQVVDEITDNEQMTIVTKYINDDKLIIESNGSLESIQEIFDDCPGLSYPDSSVLELAIRKSGIILTSDGSLRKISEKRNLTVRGVLWIINELVLQKIISVSYAINKLEMYKIINERAPVDKIEKLIYKYKTLQNGY